MIHRLLRSIDPTNLIGTIMACPCVNPPGYHAQERGFRSGDVHYTYNADLNRYMHPTESSPNSGKSATALFARAFVDRWLPPETSILLDMHTASFGRANTYYIRADMQDATAARVATLLAPNAILHSAGHAGVCLQ